MNLEQIIRPFQDRGITPPKAVQSSNKKDQTPFQAIFGEGGGKVFYYSTWETPGLETINNSFQEIRRETVKTKVKNPQDESQYVEVENTKELYLRKNTDPNEKLTLYLKPKDNK